MSLLDQAIQDEYLRHPESVDEILIDPNRAHEFAVAVKRAADVELADSDVLRRLVNMRKQSRLPKKR